MYLKCSIGYEIIQIRILVHQVVLRLFGIPRIDALFAVHRHVGAVPKVGLTLFPGIGLGYALGLALPDEGVALLGGQGCLGNDFIIANLLLEPAMVSERGRHLHDIAVQLLGIDLDGQKGQEKQQASLLEESFRLHNYIGLMVGQVFRFNASS